MDIFGIGPMELIVILILALFVFGPDRLPEMGAKLGKAMRNMRQATRQFSQEIEETRQAIQGPIDEIREPLKELAEPVQELQASAHEIATVSQDLRDGGESIRQSVLEAQAVGAGLVSALSPDTPEATPAPNAETETVADAGLESGSGTDAGTETTSAMDSSRDTQTGVAAEAGLDTDGGAVALPEPPPGSPPDTEPALVLWDETAAEEAVVEAGSGPAAASEADESQAQPIAISSEATDAAQLAETSSFASAPCEGDQPVAPTPDSALLSIPVEQDARSPEEPATELIQGILEVPSADTGDAVQIDELAEHHESDAALAGVGEG